MQNLLLLVDYAGRLTHNGDGRDAVLAGYYSKTSFVRSPAFTSVKS
jgi:hypothetical protein